MEYMTLDKKLENMGLIVGGIVGAALGLDYCSDRYDTLDFLTWSRGTLHLTLWAGVAGAAVGKYLSLGVRQLFESYHNKNDIR